MEKFLISAGVIILLLMLATLYRVVKGPTVIDRILGVNVIGIKTTVLIILIGVLDGRVEMFIDIALAYALLNFITAIAAARFFQRHAQPIAAKINTASNNREEKVVIGENSEQSGEDLSQGCYYQQKMQKTENIAQGQGEEQEQEAKKC